MVIAIYSVAGGQEGYHLHLDKDGNPIADDHHAKH